MPHKVTWLAILDAEHGRFVGHDQSGFHTIKVLVSEDAGKRASDLVTDGLGRSFESATIGRHAIEPREDPRLPARRKFAREVATELNAAATRRAFDRLVLVAPPRTLALIEAELTQEVRQHVTARLHKDLVKTPDTDLAQHFPDWPIIR